MRNRYPSTSPAPRWSSEFPHDNPTVFDGIGWIDPEEQPAADDFLSIPAPPRLPSDIAQVISAAPPVSGVEAREPIGNGLPLDDALPQVEPVISQVVSASPSDLDRLVSAVRDLAFDRGQIRAAAVLQRIWADGDSQLDEIKGDARGRLLEQGLAQEHGGALKLSLQTSLQVAGWRGVLSGEHECLDACGDQTLDELASQLLAACLGAEAGEAATLRRALRRSGVAAFGMLAA